MDKCLDKTVSEQVNITVEPLRDILEYALEKIRLDEFDEAVLNDFGTRVKSYLSFSDRNFRETEQFFIVHLNETICKFVENNANHIGSALILVYKAMSLLRTATFFLLENNTVVPRYNVACQMLTEFLFLELYRQNQDWNMVLTLIRSLISQAKKMIEEKPAFCFICCTDLIRACSLFSIDINMNWHVIGELRLLQARSALNGNSLDLAMCHCKTAEEKIYDYKNGEGFSIWAKALELKGQIPAAIEKAEDAVRYAKEGEEKQDAESYLSELYKKVDEETQPNAKKLDETWLEGTFAHAVESEQRIAKAVKESHIPRKKKSKPIRKHTDYISSTFKATAVDSLPEGELSKEASFDEDDIDRMLSLEDWNSSSENEDKVENERDSSYLDDSNSCHRHMDDPVGILSKYATSSVKKRFYSIEEYKKAWIPLTEMEAASSAVSSGLTPIINRVDLTLTKTEVSGKTIYTGSLQLRVSFCYERNIEFRGLPMERLPQVETVKKLGNDFQIPHASNDYLCIRCFLPGSSDRVGRSMENGRTWIGHGQIVKAVIKRRAEDINKKIPIDIDKDEVIVFFVLNNKSLPPPADLMLMSRITGTVEIICKIEVDRRTQHAIASLKKADDSEEKGKLVRAIVLNRNTPPLPMIHLEVTRQMDKEVKGGEDISLPTNNPKQHKAIENALKKSFSLIQGPPGTGKTYTGIKLIYLFNEINKTIQAQGGEKTQVLFCGPSNKSVDLVARYLKERLGNECPKVIRMYESNIVEQDYPIPNRNLTSRRLMHDLNSDPEIRDITLHHIIRNRGSYAKDIRMFDDLFALMLKPNKISEDQVKINRFNQTLQMKLNTSRTVITDPHRVNLTILRLYSILVEKAYAEELQSCEVVLCTCSVGGNPVFVKNTKIFQCIIGEAAMCPEPLALVPIIATDAKQVVLIGDHKQLRPIIQCSEAAELGMDQSLFERYSLKTSVLTFLDTQYRMDPQICEFPSRHFYENKLKTREITKDLPLKLWPNPNIPLVFCHVEGVEETLTVSTKEGNEQSKSNMAEADKVVQIYRWLIEKEIRVGSRNIVVLSQYNAQVSIVKQKLTEYKNSVNNPEGPRHRKLNVSTVVSSQGGEWDYVIFSTVRSLPTYKIKPAPTLGWCKSNLGFITDANQINVALTRARKGLIIVGNKNLLEVDPVWKNLLMSYERKGCLITDPDQFPKSLKKRWTKI